jgi:hypothetical protein
VGVGVENILESIDGVEEGVKESIGGEEGDEFIIASVFVGEIDGGIEHKG